MRVGQRKKKKKMVDGTKEKRREKREGIWDSFVNRIYSIRFNDRSVHRWIVKSRNLAFKNCKKKLVSFFEFVSFSLSLSLLLFHTRKSVWSVERNRSRRRERERDGWMEQEWGKVEGKEITNVVSGRMESFARADAFIAFITSVGNHE